MDKVESIIFYHIAFFLILLFLWHGRKNKKYELIGIFLLLLLSVCRYDIGNDYDNYYYIIKDSSRYFSSHDGFFSAFFRNSFKWSVEPLFAFLTYLFRNVEYNFVYVIGIYSVITIFFWYKTLKEINEHWSYSSLYDGEIIPKTFGRYKEYIADAFAIDIEYNAQSKKYAIVNSDFIKKI